MECSSFPSLLRENLAGSGSVGAASGHFLSVIFLHLPLVAAPECTNLSFLQKTRDAWPSSLVSDTREHKGRFLSRRHRPKGKPKKATGKYLLNIREETTFAMKVLCTIGQAALRGCDNSAAKNDQNSAQTQAGPSLGAWDGPGDPEVPFNQNYPMVLMPGGFLSNYLASKEHNIGNFNHFFPPLLHLFLSTKSFFQINHVLLSQETIIVITYRKNQHNSECFTP